MWASKTGTEDGHLTRAMSFYCLTTILHFHSQFLVIYSFIGDTL